VQRRLELLPGILDALAGADIAAICRSNIDHCVENLVPNMPRSHTNNYQPIEFPYQNN
jgi:hypothetical protein